MSRTTDHKEGKATVRVILKTNKTLKDGTHPFWLRITKDRQSKYIATGYSLHPRYWNEKHSGYKEAIRKSYPEPYRNELISALNQWERKYSEAANTLTATDEDHTTKDVADKAIEKRLQLRRSTVLPFIDELTANMKRAGQLGNMQVYVTLRNQLAAFVKSEYNRDILRFSDITVKFCNDFEIYLRERGNAETSMSNRFRTLRSVLNKAISEGVASFENYPFSRSVSDRHKFNIGRFNISTRKRAISRDDVRLVESFTPTATHTGQWSGVKNAAEIQRLQRAKDLFLFSFFVGGINFVDMVQLRWRDVQANGENKRLSYTRQKTGGKFSILLVSPALAIIEQYRPITFNGPDSFIFDVLRTNVHNTPKSITNRLKKVLGQVNEDLKEIGERIGLSTPLTTYVARHTMATSLRRQGKADAIIGQVMGHANEKVTAVYLDAFENDSIDSALTALL